MFELGSGVVVLSSLGDSSTLLTINLWDSGVSVRDRINVFA